MKKLLYTPFFIRLLHWEYWNSKIIYAPLYPYWIWLSIKARSFFFLTAANPGIKNGGLIMESKKDVYDMLPQAFYPVTCYVSPATDILVVEKLLEQNGIQYPFIAKPDHGERGLAVKKIENRQQLIDYNAKMPIPYLLQEYVPYQNEVGIFYCRMRGEAKGIITGIVNKEPVCVTGDGINTVSQLVKRNKRYILQWQQIVSLHAGALNDVLRNGEKLVLVPYGNHSRGSLFTDLSYKANDKLQDTINKICLQIPGFYYGRLDIRFNTWQELENGTGFSIIELNGSGSEPTHIYDPRHSIFFAWKEILRHWRLVYKLSKENNSRGTEYITLRQGREEVRAFRQIDALLSVHTW